MKFRYILFDLDGTLSASGPGITRSAQYALHKMGIEEPDADSLTFFVGPPLNLTFREHYGMDEGESKQAIIWFQERYNTKGVFENKLYSGIKEMLEILKCSGRILAIASSKPENLVYKVLESYDIKSYFTVIVGSDPALEVDNKAGADNKQQMVRKALQALKESRKESGNQAQEDELYIESADLFCRSCAMVGDRFYDIDGAKANHVSAVGVSYGYGTRKELEQAGADYIAETVEQLQNILML